MSSLAPPPPGRCTCTSGRATNVLSTLFIVLVGVLGAIQTGVNNRTGAWFGSFLFGSFISFVCGTLCLLLVTLGEACATPSPREAVFKYMRFNARPRPWQLLGGLLGVSYVTASVGITLITGYSIFFVTAVCGQMLVSAVLDTWGLLGVARRPLTLLRIAALIICVLGALLSIIDRVTANGGDTPPIAFAMCVVGGVAAGTLMPVQAAINRGMSELVPTKLQASLVSFIVGTIAVFIALTIQLLLRPDLASALNARIATSAWWMYLGGGPLGVVFIASGIFFVRSLGVSLFFVALVCGQLLGSAVLDAVGFLGSPALSTPGTRIAGIILVFLAAACMQGMDALTRGCSASVQFVSSRMSFVSRKRLPTVAPAPRVLVQHSPPPAIRLVADEAPPVHADTEAPASVATAATAATVGGVNSAAPER